MLMIKRDSRSPHLVARVHSRDLASKVAAVNAREPAPEPLLNIDIKLPGLPNIGIHLGGNNTPPQTSAANNPPPAPTPTPTQGNGNGGGNSGGNSGGNGGGNGNGGGGSGGGNGNGGGGDGNGNSGGGSSGGGNSGGSNNTPTPPSPTSGTGSGNNGSDTPASGQPGNGGGDSTGGNTSSRPTPQPGTGAGVEAEEIDGGDSSSTGGGSGGNAGGGGESRAGQTVQAGGPDRFVGSGTTLASGARVGTRTYSDGTPIPTGVDKGDENQLPAEVGANKGPNVAAIISGIIITLLCLFLLVFCLRRHRKARREQRAHMWWFSRKRTSQTYQDEKVCVVDLPAAPRASVRSSFGTSYDHSAFDLANHLSPPPPPMPTMPPIAEVRRPHTEFDPPGTGGQADKRFSIGSVGSGDSHSFVVRYRFSGGTEDIHKRSSNPFNDPSHYNSFAFPRPPSHVSPSPSMASNDSTSTIQQYATAPENSPPSARPMSIEVGDPFRDPNNSETWATRSSSSHATDTTNPFEDSSTSSHEHWVKGDETPVPVFRSFIARIPDELSVMAGDHVRVLRAYDDGWALVDKLQFGSGNVVLQQGLIPMGCMQIR